MSLRAKPDRILKKGINADETRRKREEMSIEIRRNKREESLAKKRSVLGGPVGSGEMIFDQEQDKAQSRMKTAEQLKQLPYLVADVHSNDPARQVQAVIAFRKLLSIEKQPPIQEVIDCNVVPRLVEFLRAHDNPTLQFEAAWALTNVASGTNVHTKTVIDSGAVDIFVQLLGSQSEEVREQAVWALGNIAGDSAPCRDLVLQKGALHPLLELCNHELRKLEHPVEYSMSKVTMLRNATWTLSNFTRGKPQPPFEWVAPALPVLAKIIVYSTDTEVLTDACWALSYLSDDTGTANTKIQAVIQSGVSRQLVQLLMHPSPNVKTPALRTVGNIVTGDDIQTDQIIELQALPCLLRLLSNGKKGIRKEACWTISNITAGSANQIQAVINAGLIPPLVEILQKEEFDIKKEAAWAISNATSGGDPQQIRALADAHVIPPLCDLFEAPDPKIVTVALEGVENILKVGKNEAVRAGTDRNPYADEVDACGGLDKLERLQHHDNNEIFNKAQFMIATYWGVDDESEPMAAQPVSGNQQQFPFNPQFPPQQQRYDFM